MSKILCIGEALIDMICTDKGQPLTHGDHFLKKAGGAPANVAAAIAALGGDVEMVAKVGEDPFGQHLVDVLQEMGVGTRYVLRDSRHFTTLAFVSLMQNGERDFYFNRGADAALSIEDLASIHLPDYSIIHFGSATAFLLGPLQDAYVHLLQQALLQNIYVSFDPNYRQLLYSQCKPLFVEQAWAFAKQCAFFKMSDEEAMLITGASSVDEAAAILLQQTHAVFVITLGKEGALLGLRGKTFLVPGIPVQPVDTTGAGDAFMGAVLYQLQNFTYDQRLQLNEDEWKNMVANANKAGARTCEWLGAMEAFKHLNKNIFN
ncbi:MAG TPA: carbohydrate kinase [Phnomibacter sp.]|nr:carbohydrate kinase [Phnomibacter sp.]